MPLMIPSQDRWSNSSVDVCKDASAAHDLGLIGTTSDLWSSTSHQNHLLNKYLVIGIFHAAQPGLLAGSWLWNGVFFLKHKEWLV